MWWWAAGGIALFGLILLALAMISLVRRVGPLRSALSRLQARATQAETLRAGVTKLQRNAADLQELMLTAQRHAAVRQARRDDHDS